MSQSVLAFPASRAGALRAFLASRGFVERTAPNAVLAATGGGLTVTLYRTGKLLVQGRTAAAFASEALAGLASAGVAADGSRSASRAPSPKRKRAAAAPERGCGGPSPAPAGSALIGTDEAGKGDYFGPLCVAGVVLDDEGADRLRGMGVRDGKLLADPTVLSLDGLIRADVPFAVVALDPEEYNRRHAAAGNLNTLLAALHVDVIETLVAETGCRRVLTDQFANPSVLSGEAKRRAVDVDLRQRPRAEEETAVAAASIVARAEFLRRLEALAAVAGRRLPKGASDPVDAAAREIYREGGREALARIAKLHFKTTAKVASLFS
jgi:ribonuclease HIII